MKLWIDLEPQKKSVGRVDTKGKKEKESRLDQIGVDPSLLGKSLDFGHLIKRQVQVHGKNGKIFTRMQWVNPQDASTGHGMRRINSRAEFANGVMHGLDKHPNYHAALQDQGVDLAHHDFEKHPHFYLPETTESQEHMKKQGVMSGGHIRNSNGQVSHMMHKVPDFTNKPLKEDHFLQNAEPLNDEESDTKTKDFLHKYDMFPELHDYMEDVETAKKQWGEGTTARSKWESLGKHIKDHWATVKRLVKEGIDDDSDTPDYVKNIQHKTIGAIAEPQHPFSLIASHPVVARHAVETIFGKDIANDLRFKLSVGNITINTSSEHLGSILSNGYRAENPASYMSSREHLGKPIATQEDWDTLAKLYRSSSSGADGYDIENDIRAHVKTIPRDGPENAKRRSMWDNISRRAKAEFSALGLGIHDPKPAYLAYNPNGKPEGGGVLYGDGSTVKVDAGALKHCTANMNDTFYTSSGIPKIHDMDHLKDMYILRALHTGLLDDDDHKSWLDTQNELTDDLPIELQYHGAPSDDDEFLRAHVSPDKLSVLNDVNASKMPTQTSEDSTQDNSTKHTIYASDHDPDSWDEDNFHSDLNALKESYGENAIKDKAKNLGLIGDDADWEDTAQAIGEHVSMGDNFDMQDDSDLPFSSVSPVEEKKSTSDFNLKKGIGLYIDLGGK